MKKTLLFIGALLISAATIDARQGDFSILIGSYFSQNPSEMTPELPTQAGEADKSKLTSDSGYISVPKGTGEPVLLDGIFSPGEWDDAAVLQIHPKVKMYLKKYSGHVYIGFRYFPFMGNGADLQISPDGKTIYHFHVSAQLGERLVNEKSSLFDEPAFIYGDTSGWYANEIRSNMGLRESLLAQGKSKAEAIGLSLYKYDGVEFQIMQNKFNSSEWRIRFTTAFPPEQGEKRPIVVVYPENSKLNSTEGWTRLVLGN